MIKLRQLLEEAAGIKWIVGYVDAYGAVHHKVVSMSDPIDSHNKIWPAIHHGKWRWMPSRPNELNTYGEQLDDESIDRIWQIVDTYKQ